MLMLEIANAAGMTGRQEGGRATMLGPLHTQHDKRTHCRATACKQQCVSVTV